MIRTYLLCLLILASVPFSAQTQPLVDPDFDNPGAWTFHQFNGGGIGGLSAGVGFITHPGGGGQGGTLSDEIPTSGPGAIASGNCYFAIVDRNYVSLGPSAVAELWVGEDPALAGGADYPGNVAGTMILKDDCWSFACGSTGGFFPMPIDGGAGGPWPYNSGDWLDGRVWFVLKVSGWGPGTSQTVEFDNASVDLTSCPAVSDWSLY
jgi:hypothetical protein